MQSWIEEMNVVCDKKVVYVVVGNKTDLVPDYDATEAIAFTKSINGTYIGTSAKTGSNLPQLLMYVVQGLQMTIW